MLSDRLLTVENWPILVCCGSMIAAAVIDWWKFKVPNKLTFPIILSGWALGLANNFGLGAGDGGLGAALVGTFFGMALLLPIYALGGMGAGDVKMTMGFGSWIGAFYGLSGEHNAFGIIWWAFAVGTIVGGIIAVGMILVRRRYKQNMQNVKEIVGDMFTSTGIGDIATKANARRPRWHRLPYGVPLCIGFLGYLMYLYQWNF
jgi:prepilin peptidase CpaA